MPTRITMEWLDALSFKQQTVLLSAIRGCDNVGKHDLSKKIVRKLRGTVIKDACGGDPSSDFMDDAVSAEDVYLFSKDIDKYPVHFLLHLIHAAEIVGYKHPEENIRAWWNCFYSEMVNSFHMNPETCDQMDTRLADGKATICHKT